MHSPSGALSRPSAVRHFPHRHLGLGTPVVEAVDDARQVGLQPAVLDAIGDGLNDLADMLAQRSTDALDVRIHLRPAEVGGHHAALLVSVRQFNGHLRRLLREEAADDSVFAPGNRRQVGATQRPVEQVPGAHVVSV